ncbi:MAG: FAD:protein FMN transferase, partial [Candidatus Subteraquimicrobiales bacterium]|nr:FAD:protein FMN transferase [Candidatus Subteraquimicrobiales bacterium]
KLIGVLSATNESISTSGDYQRYFEKDNKRYHHILNPKTGMPAEEIMSVTVVTKKSCAEADILSTAIFVMGYSKGMDFVKKEKGLEAVIVTLDGKVHISLGLKNKIKNLLEEI